ncbi:YL1 nuclear [Sesbania bispinosa]|nr:YL1 nuclear [Sesbania bispinosa]
MVKRSFTSGSTSSSFSDDERWGTYGSDDQDGEFEFEFQIDKQLKDHNANDFGIVETVINGAFQGELHMAKEGTDCVEDPLLSEIMRRDQRHNESMYSRDVFKEYMPSASGELQMSDGLNNDCGDNTCIGGPMVNEARQVNGVGGKFGPHVVCPGLDEAQRVDGALINPNDSDLPRLAGFNQAHHGMAHAEEDWAVLGQRVRFQCGVGPGNCGQRVNVGVNVVTGPSEKCGEAGLDRGLVHDTDMEQEVGDKVKANMDGDIQEVGPIDCFVTDRDGFITTLCSEDESNLCDVPIVESIGLEFLRSEINQSQIHGQESRKKRRRERPKKQLNNVVEVSNSNIELVQTILALGQDSSVVAERVWNLGT